MAQGYSLDACASFLDVHPSSLYSWQHSYREFSEAVEKGRAAGVAFWEGRLIEVAKGGPGHAAAIQFGLRNRSRAAGGWDHAHTRVEVAGPSGGPVQIQSSVITIDARRLNAEQRLVLRQALLEAKGQAERANEAP